MSILNYWKNHLALTRRTFVSKVMGFVQRLIPFFEQLLRCQFLFSVLGIQQETQPKYVSALMVLIYSGRVEKTMGLENK